MIGVGAAAFATFRFLGPRNGFSLSGWRTDKAFTPTSGNDNTMTSSLLFGGSSDTSTGRQRLPTVEGDDDFQKQYDHREISTHESL